MDDEKSQSTAQNFSKWLEHLPIFLGVGTAVLYVPGFIVVNAYMATKGVSEQPLLSSRYVAAGGLFLVTSVLFYFLVLKRIIQRAHKGTSSYADLPSGVQSNIRSYFFLDVIFSLCYFSSWFIGISTPSAGAMGALLTTTLVIAIDRWIFQTERIASKNKFFIGGVVLFAGIVGFFTWGVLDQSLISLTVVSSVFVLALFVVVNSEGWKDGEDKAWGTAFLVIYAVLAAAGFGATVYGHLSPRLGGGAPVKIQPLVAENANELLKSTLMSAQDRTFLLVANEGFVVMEIVEENQRKKVVNVSRDQLNGIVYASSDANDQFKEIFNQLISRKEEIVFNSNDEKRAGGGSPR